MNEVQTKRRLRQKLTDEFRRYLAVSLYLYICFGALLLYKGAVLRAEGINYTSYGLAAAKALILGKFMLIGHALRVGERYSNAPLIYPILHKSLVFLALLFVLDLIEVAISGMLHGLSFRASMSDFAGGTWLQIVATCLLVLLILLPYFAYMEVSRLLGEGVLKQMLFSKGRPRSHE